MKAWGLSTWSSVLYHQKSTINLSLQIQKEEKEINSIYALCSSFIQTVFPFYFQLKEVFVRKLSFFFDSLFLTAVWFVIISIFRRRFQRLNEVGWFCHNILLPSRQKEANVHKKGKEEYSGDIRQLSSFMVFLDNLAIGEMQGLHTVLVLLANISCWTA